MASQTGSVTSVAELVTVITDFAGANGWSANGDVLSKGNTWVRIATPGTSEIRVESARNGNFTAPDLCHRHSRIYNTIWPQLASYYISVFDEPDTVWCTLHFDNNRYQHLGFGTLEKYGSWEGGSWFHAQHTSESKDGEVCSLIDGGNLPYWPDSPSECALFWSSPMEETWGRDYRENSPGNLHCELRGHIWEPPHGDHGISIHCPTILSPIHKTSPNAFNGQTVLTPFQLFLPDSDGHYMSIGHVGHVRFVKLDHYNPGDEITLGVDRWKVFPWHIKDARYPDGKQQGYRDKDYSTGFLGVAVRYDGA